MATTFGSEDSHDPATRLQSILAMQQLAPHLADSLVLMVSPPASDWRETCLAAWNAHWLTLEAKWRLQHIRSEMQLTRHAISRSVNVAELGYHSATDALYGLAFKLSSLWLNVAEMLDDRGRVWPMHEDDIKSYAVNAKPRAEFVAAEARQMNCWTPPYHTYAILGEAVVEMAFAAQHNKLLIAGHYPRRPGWRVS